MGQKYALFDEKGFPIAFYDSEINTKIPQNAIPISDEIWLELISNQGKYVFWNGQLIDITNKIWDDSKKIWREKTEEELLQEYKNVSIANIDAQTQKFIDRTFRQLKLGRNEADALSSIQNTLDVKIGLILYYLEDDLKKQGKDASKITITTFWKKAALFLAGGYTKEQAQQELKELGVTDITIKNVMPLLKQVIEAAAMKLWDENVWDYEEQIEQKILASKTKDEINNILENIQYPELPREF